jgi:hypothetical protein
MFSSRSPGQELSCEKAGVEMETYLRLVQQLDRDADCARHGVSDNCLVSWVSQRPRGSLE